MSTTFDTEAREAFLSLPEAETDLIVKTVLVTPAMAEEFLLHNVGNRTPRPSVIERYAGDMRDGHWVENGATGVIDLNGNLRDSQHRMKAIRDSGIAVKMLLVFGVDPDAAMATIDAGTPRTLANFLFWRGERDTPDLSAAIKLAYQLETFGKPTPKAVSISTLETWFEQNAGIRDSLAVAQEWTKAPVVTPSKMAALRFAAASHGLDVAKVDGLFSGLATGANLAPGTTAYVLRSMLLDEKEFELAKKRKMNDLVRLATVINAINRHLAGGSVTSKDILWVPGKGKKAIAFPSLLRVVTDIDPSEEVESA